MSFRRAHHIQLLLSLALALPCAASAAQATGNMPPAITLAADLTDAPRKILHSAETLTVQPGPLTLVYPKWIPGEHGPTGPIGDQAGLVITANNTRLQWQRDPVDMYAVHLTVPSGVTQLSIKMDFLATAPAAGFSSGASTSASLAIFSWNTVVVYPQGTKPADILVAASIKLPAGWKFGTALEESSYPGAPIAAFKPVPLDQLIDSPVLAGRWFREILLAPEVTPQHFLDLAADGPEDLQLSQENIDSFSKLIRETGLLYKSRHYASYHFLVTLSDQVAHFGLEHHQSSDDRAPERSFVDDGPFIANGNLLPHEFTHSWNGKYRRPIGLVTPDYQTPMKGDLLWVYEGLTEYLGDVLTARCGIWQPSVYIDRLAVMAGYLNDVRPGRTWRNLQDTATSAQLLYDYAENSPYDNWRRDTDYYDEGELLWLEVDLIIRDKTKGKKSLDDFVAAFVGTGGNTGPVVVPYTFDDVVKALNAIAPNDWATFFRKRLDSNEPHAPELADLALSGYKLTYTSTPNYWEQLTEGQGAYLDTRFSLGFQSDPYGRINDVIVGSLGDKAGFGPGMRIIAVNGRGFSPTLLRTAISDAAGHGPALEFIVENTGYYKVIRLDYHDGEKYPTLERIANTPDRLTDIIQPLVK